MTAALVKGFMRTYPLYSCKVHQHKAREYMKALREAGYHLTYRPEMARFMLVDNTHQDLWGSGTLTKPVRQVEVAERLGLPVFLYPHSARPMIPFDLAQEHYAGVKAAFTFAPGYAEVLRSMGYPSPVEVTGWTYSRVMPFRPKRLGGKLRVLFAPLHPVGGGWLPEIDKALNVSVYRLLLSLQDEISLSVRHVGKLEHCGLWPERRVRFIAGQLNGDTHDMDNADLVVSAFTYAYMAVALGKPLVMFGDYERPHNTPWGRYELNYAKRWEAYRDYYRYPYNIEATRYDEKAASKLFRDAMENEPAEWKKLFIGEPFDGKEFVKKLEAYLDK